jgi:hypothetical protein
VITPGRGRRIGLALGADVGLRDASDFLGPDDRCGGGGPSKTGINGLSSRSVTVVPLVGLRLFGPSKVWSSAASSGQIRLEIGVSHLSEAPAGTVAETSAAVDACQARKSMHLVGDTVACSPPGGPLC